jgi:hypothetical protein
VRRYEMNTLPRITLIDADEYNGRGMVSREGNEGSEGRETSAHSKEVALGAYFRIGGGLVGCALAAQRGAASAPPTVTDNRQMRPGVGMS